MMLWHAIASSARKLSSNSMFNQRNKRNVNVYVLWVSDLIGPTIIFVIRNSTEYKHNCGFWSGLSLSVKLVNSVLKQILLNGRSGHHIVCTRWSWLRHVFPITSNRTMTVKFNFSGTDFSKRSFSLFQSSIIAHYSFNLSRTINRNTHLPFLKNKEVLILWLLQIIRPVVMQCRRIPTNRCVFSIFYTTVNDWHSRQRTIFIYGSQPGWTALVLHCRQFGKHCSQRHYRRQNRSWPVTNFAWNAGPTPKMPAVVGNDNKWSISVSSSMVGWFSNLIIE